MLGDAIQAEDVKVIIERGAAGTGDFVWFHWTDEAGKHHADYVLVLGHTRPAEDRRYGG